MFRLLLLGFILFNTLQIVAPTPIYAMSLDDDEEDAEDVADLLAQAKKEGKNESFSKANALLKKAKMYGVSRDDTKEASRYVAGKKQARDDRLERKRKEKERLARVKREREKREERARLARQRQRQRKQSYSSSSSSSSSSLDYVMVTFNSVCGFSGCIDKNLHISGGPGSFSPSYSGAYSGAIHKGYNGLAGRYSWSAQLDRTVCSGSFYVSGRKRNITISIHKDCYGLYISEY